MEELPQNRAPRTQKESHLRTAGRKTQFNWKLVGGGLKTTRPEMLHGCDCQESQDCCVLHHKVHTCVLLKSSSSAPGLSKARGWEAEVRLPEASGRSPGSENGVLWPQQTAGKKPPQLLLLPNPSLRSRPSLPLLTCPAQLEKFLEEPPLTAHSIQSNSRPRLLLLAYVFIYLLHLCVCLFVFQFWFLRKRNSWLRCLFSQSPSVKCPARPGGSSLGDV